MDDMLKAFTALGNLDDHVGRVYWSVDAAFDAYTEWMARRCPHDPMFTFSGWLRAKKIRILDFDDE